MSKRLGQSSSPGERSRSAEPLAVNQREAAALLGISERLLWSWTNARKVPHVRLGARVLYPVDLLRKWLEDSVKITKQ